MGIKWAKNRISEKECLVCKIIFKRDPHVSSNYFSKRKYCSSKCMGKVNGSKNGFKKGWGKPKTAFFKGESRISGSSNHRWRGGVSSLNTKLRNSEETKKWRRSVFIRDNFTCMCGQVGGKLEAHHIKSWAKFPELRHDINNGITLCVECHKLTDNYKNKKNE